MRYGCSTKKHENHKNIHVTDGVTFARVELKLLGVLGVDKPLFSTFLREPILGLALLSDANPFRGARVVPKNETKGKKTYKIKEKENRTL